MRAARPSRAVMGGGNLFALDFDGVFYDSYGQSSLSAVKDAKVRWSWVFEQVAPPWRSGWWSRCTRIFPHWVGLLL